MIKNPNGKLLNSKITFQPYTQGLGIYKHQIRWMQDTAKYFRKEEQHFTAEQYENMTRLLKQRLKNIAK